MQELRIAFVAREVYPFGGGGLGNYVTFTAAALAPHAEVTVLTSTRNERRYEELRDAADPRLPAGVRFEFVPEPRPEEIPGWYGHAHAWSARAFEALVDLFDDGGPDLVEFPDFIGEGCVAVQAAVTRDPRLRNTLVAVRFYTTAEIAWILNGHLGRGREARMLIDLERYALRYADRLISPGDSVLDTYRRFYGHRDLAPAVTIRHAVSQALPAAPLPGESEPARLLYIGRVERRKGVQDLVRAATASAHRDWTLTMVGADTPTAPLGLSMRDQLELMADGDERIEFAGTVSRAEVLDLIARSHAVVSPSLWECWPNAVIEALQLNRPVLATPVGGHVDMVSGGESGWLAASTGAAPLHERLEELLGDRTAAAALAEAGGPRREFERLTDTDAIVDAYIGLCAERPRGRRPARVGATEAPTGESHLVSVVIPYFEMDRFLEQALESVAAQTFSAIEVIVVNDGSLREEDRVLVELADRLEIRVATQPNSGLGQARNFGVALSTGRYVLPLDPDNLLAPTFVERCVEVLVARPEVAYVTSWSRYIDEKGRRPAKTAVGYQPLGNAAATLDLENVAGDAIALIRRRVFDRGFRYSPDMTSYEDWLLYRELRAHGLIGHVIPERLIRYRVRAKSMLREFGAPNEDWLLAEMDARVAESEVTWTSSRA